MSNSSTVKLDPSAMEIIGDVVKKDKLFYLLWGSERLKKVPVRKTPSKTNSDIAFSRIPFNHVLMKRYAHSSNGTFTRKIHRAHTENSQDDSNPFENGDASRDMDFFEFMLSDVRTENESDTDADVEDESRFSTDDSKNIRPTKSFFRYI